MQKIRYRLIYNRKHILNKQGTALIQVEAKLNQRNIYLTTNVYVKPEHWNKDKSEVINHPQSVELNSMLFEYIIYLQGIELSFWKRGIQPTLALLRDAVKKKSPVNITFTEFARKSIMSADKSNSTKENLMSTVRLLDRFRPGLTFEDLSYTFLKDFEAWLRNLGKNQNTTGKHLRQLRTLTNEAINDGYMPADAYPFRKFKIKIQKAQKPFLTPDELGKLERLHLEDVRQQHILDAFLFCCYTGLRFSDFRTLTTSNIVPINRKKWLCVKMQKTNIEIKLPLELLFEGKALDIIDKYDSIEQMASIPINADTNKILVEIAEKSKIKKHFTFHTARHTCATLLIHQGVAITTVQKLLGHTSVKTTEIYSEVLSSTIVKDLKALKKKKSVNKFPIISSC
ncbi:site-specific integrase [Bacteroides caecigallinarum]|uniref:site-specific integrase n=1 Tax=Bacteroides caecigallinarum TaxID=1411144 RepID=UPI001959317C|nr:site-specific integrase [Bacteroides caecigallinarum]MBM6865672.1 site-specific integrase [Bacteroides caecigallinarum]